MNHVSMCKNTTEKEVARRRKKKANELTFSGIYIYILILLCNEIAHTHIMCVCLCVLCHGDTTYLDTVKTKFHHKKFSHAMEERSECFLPFEIVIPRSPWTHKQTHAHPTDGTRWKMNLNFIAPLWHRKRI